jgi:GTP-binding protein
MTQKKAAILTCEWLGARMSLFRNATYIASAHRLQDLPPPREPEIAFAGRSNAGKSSAINALADHTRLAFVSKTPGRTQTINLFRLASGGILADLPGYGYAKVPEAMRRHWEETLSGYLRTRASLCGLALIMDARHPLTERDEMMLAWFRPTGRPIHVLLTKADKLSRTEARAALQGVRQRLEPLGTGYTAQLFSSLQRSGVEEAEAVFARWLGAPENAGTAPANGNKKAPGQRGKLGAKRLKCD